MFRPSIGITMGDPAGIGPEVIVKALNNSRIDACCQPVIIGSSSVMRRAGGQDLPVIDCVPVDLRRIRPGKVSQAAGRATAQAVAAATQMALAGELAAVVTAPACKQALHLAGLHFPGQTELLAHLTRTRRFAMMLVAGEFRVVLVTTHLPLSRVSTAITRARVRNTIILTHSALRRLLGIRRPRIAVCALNPHAGDGGIFGRDEGRTIAPAIEEAGRRGISVEGPLSADTMFAPHIRRRFDAIVAMYHDQGLIPIKMCGFGRTVNVTLGLPIIRTSPDHGTAFDIAGKGLANPASMIRAIQLAVRLAKRRTGLGVRELGELRES